MHSLSLVKIEKKKEMRMQPQLLSEQENGCLENYAVNSAGENHLYRG